MSTQAIDAPAPAADVKPEKAVATPKKRPIRLIALGVMAVIGLAVGGYYWLHAGEEATDDAQVEADVVSVPSRVGGVITAVHFTDNQPVKKGDLLVELDDAQYTARLAEAETDLLSAKAGADAADDEAAVVEATARGQKTVAEASLESASVGATTSGDQVRQAEAQVESATIARDQARTDLDRIKRLFESQSVSKGQFDSAQSAFDGAEANLAQAKAHRAVMKSSTAEAHAKILEAKARVGQTSAVESQIAQARARASAAHAKAGAAQAMRDLAALDLAYTKILAPSDGIASKRSVVAGQMLAPGQPIVQIVPDGNLWIVANFKETQLGRMRVGQPAEISVDAYPGLTLHGVIESFSGATGARFSLLPPENATGNFTKVVQRVPVRISLKDAPQERPLRAGLSADVTIKVK